MDISLSRVNLICIFNTNRESMSVHVWREYSRETLAKREKETYYDEVKATLLLSWMKLIKYLKEQGSVQILIFWLTIRNR